MIQITEAAQHYIRERLTKESGVGLRVTVKKTGCSGFSYEPSIITKINAADIPVEFPTFTLFLDSTWQALLLDLEVDYIEENKAGLKQKRLNFHHPKEKNRCGCGESFQIETDENHV